MRGKGTKTISAISALYAEANAIGVSVPWVLFWPKFEIMGASVVV